MGHSLTSATTVINVTKLKFTAISGFGVPILAELLPLANRCLPVRNALTALAGLMRAQRNRRAVSTLDPEDREIPSRKPLSFATALERYQIALSTLRQKITTLDCGHTCDDDVLEILGSAVILTVAGFPRTASPEDSHGWSHHIHGMTSLIESLGREQVIRHDFGRLFRGIIAHFDIGAFSLGRSYQSRNLWLEWNIFPPGSTSSSDFSPLEVVIGYPLLLLTIISTISAVVNDADELASPELEQTAKVLYSHVQPPPGAVHDPNLPGLAPSDIHIPSTTKSKLQAVLLSWEHTSLPDNMSATTAIAVTGAWEILRKAALLYLWRGGFNADVLGNLTSSRKRAATQLTREILAGLRMLLGQYVEGITIINAMIWPLAVIGNECCLVSSLQHEVEAVLARMQADLQIEHLKHLSMVLRELWRRSGDGQKFKDHSGPPIHLTMEGVSREMGLCIPLF